MLVVKTAQQVLSLINEQFCPLNDRLEWVNRCDALNRVLAQSIMANEYVPSFDRSTVDGYAVRSKDTFGCSDSIPAILPLQGRVEMGELFQQILLPNHCIYVPTGGAIPSDADCAIMLEYCEDYLDGTIGISKSGAPGMNIIFKGDDVYPGKLLYSKGKILNSADIGALAALGIETVSVKMRLNIGIISSGDELVKPCEHPIEGQVRDVNAPLLCAMLSEHGAACEYLGIVKDDESELERLISLNIDRFDAIILSGGSSVGDKDSAARVIKRLGELLLHGIAIKPGKPTIIGKCNDKPIIALPGHPVAVFFVTRLFVLPLLDRLMGCKHVSATIMATLSENVDANHGRLQCYSCKLIDNGDGLLAQPVRTKSGLITSLSGTDGFFCVDRDCEGLLKGSSVLVHII